MVLIGRDGHTGAAAEALLVAAGVLIASVKHGPSLAKPRQHIATLGLGCTSKLSFPHS